MKKKGGAAKIGDIHKTEPLDMTKFTITFCAFSLVFLTAL
jgi:hypothetical protein